MVPDIYRYFRDKVPFYIGKFFFIFLLSIIYSVVIYFVPLAVMSSGYYNESGYVKFYKLCINMNYLAFFIL